MRLDRVGGVAEAAALIRGAVELGVTTFHVSQEYATWPLFADAWREANVASEGVQIIAKIGMPHFGEDAFNPKAFAVQIDLYRQALKLDRVDVVQWLLRHNLKDEAARQTIFDRDADLIGETVQAMRAEDRIGSLMSFPYTRDIASRALQADWCDGLVVYCNALELEMANQMDAAAARGRSIVAIRPFAAGRVFTETGMTAAEAVGLPLTHPATAAVVASVSSLKHLVEVLTATEAVESGAAAWAAATLKARESVHV